MAVNRGKQFEDVVRDCLERIPGVSVDRLPDQMGGYKGSQNICDFIVYKEPHEFYFECKSVHGNLLSIYGTDPKKRYGLITNTQWEGLLEKSKIPGVTAGILCWWIDRDVTMFLPIQILNDLRENQGYKSYRYDFFHWDGIEMTTKLEGVKKRVFFDYDMEKLLEEIGGRYGDDIGSRRAYGAKPSGKERKGS